MFWLGLAVTVSLGFRDRVRVWWGICIRLCYTFPTESNRERLETTK